YQSLGTIRDYNGGLLFKQKQILQEYIALFSPLEQKEQEIIESFFYSLFPVESQATTPIAYLAPLFALLLEAVEHPQYSFPISCPGDGSIVAVFKVYSVKEKLNIDKALKESSLNPSQLINGQMTIDQTHYIGYCYLTFDEKEGNQFMEIVSSIRKKRSLSKRTDLVVSVPEITSLDPRIGTDKHTTIFTPLLFEGLTRFDISGKVICAVASRYSLSSDRKTYHIFLKESQWSNGSLLTSYDFAHSWKHTMLSQFDHPFALLFQDIACSVKGKKGQHQIHQIAITTPNSREIIVELKQPVPYFLQLLAHPAYSPVHHRIDHAHPEWATHKGNKFICNGPFHLAKTSQDNLYQLVRNPHYSGQVKPILEKITFYIGKDTHPNIDLWCTQSPPNTPSTQEIKMPISKVSWIMFNTQAFPFHNLNIRKALSLSIDRNKLDPEETPAYSPLPKNSTYYDPQHHEVFQDDVQAKEYFNRGLKELDIKKEEFPCLFFEYSESRDACFLLKITKHWESLFGVQCKIRQFSWDNLFHRLSKGHFHLGIMRWFAWINDPFFTLYPFQSRNMAFNFSQWENARYSELITKAQSSSDTNVRDNLLAQAEHLLMNQVVIIPLQYETRKYWKKTESPFSFNSCCHRSALDGQIDLSYVTLDQ
ncbi:MAG: peptide ABC transporter substrate-binding protein, partial [Chlamydiota bacterium]|nr:peptide ABC transporter substrate-binding protein [Chlamydiota bacterium]